MYIYIIKYPLALHKASFALQERMCVVPCSGSSPLPPEGKLARSSAEALLSGTDTSPYGTWICFGPDALKDNTTHVKSLRDARLHLMYRHIEMFYIQYMYAYGAYCVCVCVHTWDQWQLFRISVIWRSYLGKILTANAYLSEVWLCIVISSRFKTLQPHGWPFTFRFSVDRVNNTGSEALPVFVFQGGFHMCN